MSELERVTREDLSAYLDGELDPTDRARVEARLHTDAELREDLESLRWTVEFLKAAPLKPLPEGRTFAVPVDSAAENQRSSSESEQGNSAPILRPRFRRPLLPPLALGALAAGIGTVLLVGAFGGSLFGGMQGEEMASESADMDADVESMDAADVAEEYSAEEAAEDVAADAGEPEEEAIAAAEAENDGSEMLVDPVADEPEEAADDVAVGGAGSEGAPPQGETFGSDTQQAADSPNEQSAPSRQTLRPSASLFLLILGFLAVIAIALRSLGSPSRSAKRSDFR